MKTNSKQFITCLMLVLFMISSVSAARTWQKTAKVNKTVKSKKNEEIRLFNGKDLSNWVFYLKDASADPLKVFTVYDGIINIKGEPFGYMRSKDIFSDYKLHVEWRWPHEATNSGIFIHATPPDTIWIKTIECQLAAGKAGDFVCMGGTDMNERKDKSSRVVSKMAPSSEKATGEWNTMEIMCRKNTIKVFVNGVLQNKGTGVSENKGHICLQSEGKDIQFRNVFITKLKK